jgi:hypothetical protein
VFNYFERVAEYGGPVRDVAKSQVLTADRCDISLRTAKFKQNISLHRNLVILSLLGNSLAFFFEYPNRKIIVVFWVVTPCSNITEYQGFGGPCCLHKTKSRNPKFRIIIVIIIVVFLSEHRTKKVYTGSRSRGTPLSRSLLFRC